MDLFHMKGKKLNAYFVLGIVFGIVTCVVTAIWFIAFDKTQNGFYFITGLVMLVNYLLSLVSIKMPWLYVVNGQVDKDDKLCCFIIWNIGSFLPIINIGLLIFFFFYMAYETVKHIIELIKTNFNY